jgi:hypothetical protein
MTDATLYTERGLPRRSAKEKASGTIEQIQVKKQPIIEGEIRKKRAYTRRSDKENTKRSSENGKRKKQRDPEDEPQPKRRKISAKSKEKDLNSNITSKQESEESEGEDSEDVSSENSASEGSAETRIHKYETITENVFVNRKPRKLKEEEMPVCNCPRLSSQPSPGAVPCGPQCINRMMCIECVVDHCPSGDYCTNQRFQRKDYPHVTLFDAGKKGLGVKTTSEIKSGQLVIEYVGEVISIDEARKRMGVDSDESSDDENETPRKRRRAHFYTLTLTGNECIDASRKGNIARFINHSCDPNCITQKWFVNGETRVGIFAIRDIAKEDELTFDYQFERFGSSRQRCYCGSKNCRKFLCAKPVKELISTNKSENKRRCRHIIAQPQPQLSYFMRQFKDYHYDLPDSDDEDSEGDGRSAQQEEEETEKPIDYRDIVEDSLVVNTRIEPNEPPLFLKRNINVVRKARRWMYRALLFTLFQKEKEEAEKRKKARDEEKKKKRDSNWMFSVSVERLLKKNLVEITE